MKNYLLRILVVCALLALFLVPGLPIERVLASSTLILRPSATGNETSITSQHPASTSHWDKVDEATSDEWATYISTTSGSYLRDLYALPDHTTESGLINSVKIYFRIATWYTAGCYAKPSQKSGVTITDGTQQSTTSYTTFDLKSQTYPTNPATGVAYTWSEIDGLQVGVSLKAYGGAACTQVYVEVNYTPTTIPTVTTQDAIVTSNTTATGNGNITDKGGLDVDVRGFDWDIDSGIPYSNNATDTGNFTTGAYIKALTGLPAGTTIYYRAKVHNSAGWGYGSELTFATNNFPLVTTQAASGVTENASTLNGNITSLGGDVSCLERGFVFGTSSHPGDPGNVAPPGGYSTNITEAGIFGLGAFDSDQTGLIGATPYFYRAYAENSYGYDYGPEITFTTTASGLKLWIEWQYGTTFTDLSGNGNDAAPSFRTTSSDNDVSAALSTFSPLSEPEAPVYAVGAGPDFVSTNITITGNFTSGNSSSTYPGESIIRDITTATGVPYQLPSTFIATFLILIASMVTSYFLKQHAAPSMFVKSTINTAGYGIAVALHIYDWWMLIFFFIFEIAFWFAAAERKA